MHDGSVSMLTVMN